MKKLIINPKEKVSERPYVEVTREVHRWIAEIAARTGRPKKEVVNEVFSYAREHMEIVD